MNQEQAGRAGRQCGVMSTVLVVLVLLVVQVGQLWWSCLGPILDEFVAAYQGKVGRWYLVPGSSSS